MAGPSMENGYFCLTIFCFFLQRADFPHANKSYGSQEMDSRPPAWFSGECEAGELRGPACSSRLGNEPEEYSLNSHFQKVPFPFESKKMLYPTQCNPNNFSKSHGGSDTWPKRQKSFFPFNCQAPAPGLPNLAGSPQAQAVRNCSALMSPALR